MKKILLFLLLTFSSFATTWGLVDVACSKPAGTWWEKDSTFVSQSFYNNGNFDGTYTNCYGSTALEYDMHLEGTSTDRYTGQNYLYILSSLPVCDVNQTLDISVKPPICVDNIPPTDPSTCNNDEILWNNECTRCPLNSAPNTNKLKCDCVYPFVLGDLEGVPTCVLSDIDNDGIPDINDPFDDNTYCKNNIYDCTPNCVCRIGTNESVGVVGLCASAALGSYKGKFCTPTDENGADTPGDNPDDILGDGGSSNPDNNPNCSHPSELFNHPFQKFTSEHECALNTGNGSLGSNFPTPECPRGDVACYFGAYPENNDTNNNDNNNGDGGTVGDSNSSGTVGDSNSSSNFDTSALETKLDAINDALSNDGAVSKGIESLGAINQRASDTNHQDLNDLGSKLDTINDSINSQNAQATDMTNTNQKLDDIKTILNGSSSSTFNPSAYDTPTVSTDIAKVTSIKDKVSDLSIGIDEATTLMGNVKTEFSTFSTNIQSSYDSLIGDFAMYEEMFQNKPVVSIPAAGSCSLTATVYGNTIDFGTNMCVFFTSIKPHIVFVFSLGTQLILIYLSILLFKKD
jgi:hypothetical protein